MANTFETYLGDGATNLWSVPFAYISKEHVHLYVDDVEDTAFSWVTDSSIAASSIPAYGSTVLVKRITPRGELTVVIPNAGTLRGKDINTQSLQALYVAEEGYDALIDIMKSNSAGTAWDADERRITNVADPVDDQDATTKKWVVDRTAESVAAAAASASSAASSASTASAAASTATTKASQASTSEANAASSASTASSAASTATTQAGIATTKATATAADAVATAADRAAVAADKATVAADKATVAADKATVASDKTTVAGYKVSVEADKTAIEELIDSFVAGIPIASSVPFTPAGGISANNVQDALEELDSELAIAAPAGSMMMWPKSTPPTGWLVRDGSALSRTAYAALFAVIGTTFGTGNGSTTFNLPDDRGIFERGWDNGAGMDSGRAFGSYQADAFQGHRHSASSSHNLQVKADNSGAGNSTVQTVRSQGTGAPYNQNVIGGVTTTITNDGSTGSSGTARVDDETRPKNRAYLPIIKY